MTGPPPAAVPRRRGLFWPLFFGGLLVANVVFDAAVVFVASSDRSFAVERDYYQKALDWDRAMAQESVNRALGWSVEIGVTPAEAPGLSEISALLRDAAGAPVEGLTVGADVFHNARAAEVLTAGFEPAGGGRYRARLPLRRAGLWEVRLRAQRGGETFTAVVTTELGAAP